MKETIKNCIEKIEIHLERLDSEIKDIKRFSKIAKNCAKRARKEMVALKELREIMDEGLEKEEKRRGVPGRQTVRKK